MTLDEAKKCINISGIYLFRNKINGKCYVGQAIKIRKRFLQHLAKYRSEHHYPLYQALNKYGLENFEFEILETFEGLDQETLSNTLNDREIYWIDYYKGYEEGYNQTIGGASTSGWVPSEETRKKLSDALMGHPGNPEQMRPCKFINKDTLEWYEFESASEAAKFFKINHSSIINRIDLIYKSPLKGCYLSKEQYEYYQAQGIDDFTFNSGQFNFIYTKEEFLERINNIPDSVQITKKNIPELFGICAATFYNYLKEWNIPSPLQTHRKYKYLIVEDTNTNKYCKYTLSEFADKFGLSSESSVRTTAKRCEDNSLYKKRYKIYSVFEHPYGYVYSDQDGELHHFKNIETKHTIISVRSDLLSLFDIMDDITNWIKID